MVFCQKCIYLSWRSVFVNLQYTLLLCVIRHLLDQGPFLEGTEFTMTNCLPHGLKPLSANLSILWSLPVVEGLLLMRFWYALLAISAMTLLWQSVHTHSPKLPFSVTYVDTHTGYYWSVHCLSPSILSLCPLFKSWHSRKKGSNCGTYVLTQHNNQHFKMCSVRFAQKHMSHLKDLYLIQFKGGVAWCCVFWKSYSIFSI